MAVGEVGVGEGKDGHGREAAQARRLAALAQASARSSASTNIAATSKPDCCGDLLKAGRARDVDLGEAVADDVEADQQQAARRQRRPDRFGDLAVARRQRLRDALAADGEVAADLAALRDARQRMRHRHAVDDEDPLVAGGDLGEVALRHHRRRAVAVERLGDAAEVEAVGADAKDAHASHAVERLEDDVAVLGMEALDRRLVARHDRRRDVLRELEDGELLRVFAQGLRRIEDARAFALGLRKQMGRVEVLAVERRVLSHQHRVGVGERHRRRRRGLDEPGALLGAASAIARTSAPTRPPRCQTRSFGSHARARARAPPPSRIIANVVSL